jgi:predicted nucleotidyltransferase
MTMNVHGFRDTYQRADELTIADGLSIRILRAEGYAILKTHAWLDPSSAHYYKDCPDLALAVYWHAQDLNRMYDDANHWALEKYDFDLYQAAPVRYF